MKKFVVEDSFWELFPEVEIGVLCVDGILPTDQISEENARSAEAFLNRANANAEKWLTSTTISQNEVVAVWRKAYQQFKTKKGARCSVENLLKRVLKENPVGHIVPSVDVSNAMSLKYALPIGAENSDAIEGTFRLAKTEGGDYPRCPARSPTSTTPARSAAAGTGATASARRSRTRRRTACSSWRT